MLVIVDTILLLTTSLTFFDLSIISPATPISAALRQILLVVDEGSSLFVAVAQIASIFFGLPTLNALQHAIIPSGRPKDWARTFLVPAGITPIIASGFIDFKGPDSAGPSILSECIPTGSSKNPFATSFRVPSPPIDRTFLNPCFRNCRVSVDPSPAFLVKATSRLLPSTFLISEYSSSHPFPVTPLLEFRLTTNTVSISFCLTDFFLF